MHCALSSAAITEQDDELSAGTGWGSSGGRRIGVSGRIAYSPRAASPTPSPPSPSFSTLRSQAIGPKPATMAEDTRAAPRLPPSARSVTLILRHMPGVAHTTASDLDPDHKEIHLSLTYLARIPPACAAAEITGVLIHELVHCFQHDACGSCPTGLVEGIADWVRLRCGLTPPHWSHQSDDGPWDAGYHRTAYFLEYLDARFSRCFVCRLNQRLCQHEYDETTV